MTTPGRPLDAADRLRKLRAMSLSELWTRIRYDVYCRLERRRHTRGALTDPERLRRALVPALRKTADWRVALLQARRRRPARFFAGVEALSYTRALFLERYAGERQTAHVEACRALRHEFTFFGGTFRYGDKVDWHADPVTGAQWPRVYHRDVPVHGGDVGFGDVKYVWELGRHQFLIDLAKAWAIERDPRYASAMRTLVAHWRAENPVGTGVAWSCALEPAFRSLSWLWSYFLTLDDPAFDSDAHVAWLEGFHDHGWFLYRHLEYYTSPFNHLTGEACALYALGTLFPEFAESPRWRARGRRVLESRLASQFYADGGSVEQSTFYHHATLGFYMLAALLGRANGEEFPDNVWRAIERGIEFSAVLQQPDGSTPRIGGADDGKPIRLEPLPLWDFRPYQALGAVLFGRADFKAAAGRFYEDALWLLGPAAAAAFDGIDEQPPMPASRVLPASGYVVLRSRWAPSADYLCFDCGEQAAGLRRDAISSAAHGHADCLSVIIWRGGRPVLVDAGFYCYNGPKAWQDHFRETAAHNTVRIDGRDQAHHIAKMAWSHTYAATLDGCGVEPSYQWALAHHDGYRNLPQGAVTHRRAMWVRDRGYVLICDWLEGAGEHDVELVFQFAPGRLAVAEGTAGFEDIARLRWVASGAVTARVTEGGGAPDAGWIAQSLGIRNPAPRLVVAGRLDLPATLVTVITDLALEPLTVSATDGALVITGDRWADWLLVRGLEWGGSTGLQTDALAAAWSERNGRLEPAGHLGGTFQRSTR